MFCCLSVHEDGIRVSYISECFASEDSLRIVSYSCSYFHFTFASFFHFIFAFTSFWLLLYYFFYCNSDMLLLHSTVLICSWLHSFGSPLQLVVMHCILFDWIAFYWIFCIIFCIVLRDYSNLLPYRYFQIFCFYFR